LLAPAPAPAPGPGGPVMPRENINLPTGPAPIQVLVSIDAGGKLVIKTARMAFVPAGPPVPVPGGLPGPGGGPGGAPAGPPANPAGAADLPANGGGPGGGVIGFPGGGLVARLHAQTYDLKEVGVLNNRGKKLTGKEVRNLLKKETVALASLGGQAVDP